MKIFNLKILLLLLIAITKIHAQDTLYVADTLSITNVADTLFNPGYSEINNNGYVYHNRGNFFFGGSFIRKTGAGISSTYTVADNTYPAAAKLIYVGKDKIKDTLKLPRDTTGLLLMNAGSSVDTLYLDSLFHSARGFWYKKGILETTPVSPIVYLRTDGVQQVIDEDSSFVQGPAIWKFTNVSVGDTAFYPIGDTVYRPMYVLVHSGAGLNTNPPMVMAHYINKKANSSTTPGNYQFQTGYWKLSITEGKLNALDSARFFVSIRNSDTLTGFSNNIYRILYSFDETGTYSNLSPYNVVLGNPIIKLLAQNYFYDNSFSNSNSGTTADDSLFLTLAVNKCVIDSIQVLNSGGRYCEGDTLGVQAYAQVEDIANTNFIWQITRFSGGSFSYRDTIIGNLFYTFPANYGGNPPYKIGLILSEPTCLADSIIKFVPVDTAMKLITNVFLQGRYLPATNKHSENGDYFTLLKYNFEDPGTPSIWRIDSMFPGYEPPISSGDSAVDVMHFYVLDASNNVVDSTLGWVMPNGTVRDFKAGIRPVINFGCYTTIDTNANYKLVAIHKNHIPLVKENISFTKVLGVGSVSTVNFTDTTNLLGTQNVNYLWDASNNVVLMAGGNAHDFPSIDEYTVNSFDFYKYVVDNGIISNKYVRTDFNLDGNVNATDLLIVRPNNNKLIRSALIELPNIWDYYKTRVGSP